MPRARSPSAAMPSTSRASMRATRKQFGRPLCEFQGLQWKFAEMAIKLDGAQLLLYRAAANADSGLPSAYETAVAKARLQSGRLGGCQRGDADHGRDGLQPGVAGRVLRAPQPRLDDRGRLDRDPQEPHRRDRYSTGGSTSEDEMLTPPDAAAPRSGTSRCSRRARRARRRIRRYRPRPRGGRCVFCGRRASRATSIRSIRKRATVLGERAWPLGRQPCPRFPSTPTS